MRRDPRLEIITEAVERLIPGATPAFLTVTVTETLPGTRGHDGEPHKHAWTGRPEGLAVKVFTALYGRPGAVGDSVEERSPLARAEDAKRRRDLGGEIDALMTAGAALESAPWYPCRRGDVVLVHHPAVGDVPLRPAWGETYVVDDAGDGLMSMKLVAHSLPDSVEYADGMTGCYAVEAADCPIYEAWFEAGAHLLTIVRDGRPVHTGGAR